MKLEDSILPYLGKTMKMLDMYIEDQLTVKNIPLSRLQFVFLLNISRNEGETQGCLAQMVARDKTTFTRNMSTLEKKGLIMRKSSSQDKRSKQIYLTDSGKDFLDRSKPIIEEIMEMIEEGISADERTAFIDTINKIKNKLIEKRGV